MAALYLQRNHGAAFLADIRTHCITTVNMREDKQTEDLFRGFNGQNTMIHLYLLIQNICFAPSLSVQQCRLQASRGQRMVPFM